MNNTELLVLSITELKAICASHAIEPVGDKRSKQTWINAVVTFYSSQTVVIASPAIAEPFEIEESPVSNVPAQPSPTVELNSKSPATPSTHRQASIVALVIVVFFGTAFLIIKLGFTSLAWIIASAVPTLTSWWRCLVSKPATTQAIDYIVAPG